MNDGTGCSTRRAPPGTPTAGVLYDDLVDAVWTMVWRAPPDHIDRHSGMSQPKRWLAIGPVDQDGPVLGHLGINVPDLESARCYYGELLPLVGFEPFIDDADQFAFMPAEGKRGTFLFFYPTRSPLPYSRFDTTGLQHLAFMVRTRSAVHELHQWALSAGCTVLHEPTEFPEYPPPYFATFWLDPFGMMLEAVCHHDRD